MRLGVVGLHLQGSVVGRHRILQLALVAERDA